MYRLTIDLDREAWRTIRRRESGARLVTFGRSVVCCTNTSVSLSMWFSLGRHNMGKWNN